MILCASSGVESFLRKYRQRDSNLAGRRKRPRGFSFMEKTSFKMTRKLAKEIKRITIKSPSIPLFQRGKLTSPPFGVFLLPEAGKGRQGGIFKALKYYEFRYS
jgi:hypothetical protein